MKKKTNKEKLMFYKNQNEWINLNKNKTMIITRQVEKKNELYFWGAILVFINVTILIILMFSSSNNLENSWFFAILFIYVFAQVLSLFSLIGNYLYDTHYEDITEKVTIQGDVRC